MSQPKTMFQKIWDSHLVHKDDEGICILYIDRHLVHDGTSPQAFEGLRESGRSVRQPGLSLAVADHNVPTTDRSIGLDSIVEPESRLQVEALSRNCEQYEIELFEMLDKRQGIVHVIGPEQGFTLPGATVVCADSHTSTHGAFGCLAFGIGTSEVEHVLATQTLRTPQPKSMLVQVDGVLPRGTSGKDLILHLIGIIGTGGGTGYVIEYQGEAIKALSMDGRMTVSNMTIEGGARAGLIAPDEKTFAYLKGRPKTPQGAEWDAAMAFWKTIATDPGAKFDKTVRIDVSEIAPTITWGTSPEDVVPITGRVPDPSVLDVPEKRKAMERAIAYMGLLPGQPMADLKVDRVFIGSCTNSRLEDMRMAAEVVKGRKVASHIVEAMISPGSWAVKKQAEAEGLDKIFTEAGFQWRESGCSMCAGMNLDRANPYERVASTNNRNFEGRQGRNARTHLVSPAMAAAAAIAGRLVDVREYLN